MSGRGSGGLLRGRGVGGVGAPLVGRPVGGPAVSGPDAVGGMRVLGAATLPAGSGPDPSGSVEYSPAAGVGALGHARPVRSPLDRSLPVLEKEVSPRRRWEAAVARQPLEAPRALPTAFHAMASAITGRARAPLFTTGPATRAALAAAGALGATTGTVVHLPAVPTATLGGVLAHELTHTRSPVRRPRFLLEGASGLLDDDERQALAAGREQAGAGIVDSLPVGGGMGAVGDVATRAARAVVLEATAGGALGGSAGSGNGLSALGNGLLGAAGETASGAVAAASGALGSAGGAAAHAAGDAIGAAAGNAVGAAAKSVLDPDQIVEIVEQRLLREIERRGGRWAGVF
jgi:hypothetical protein